MKLAEETVTEVATTIGVAPSKAAAFQDAAFKAIDSYDKELRDINKKVRLLSFLVNANPRKQSTNVSGLRSGRTPSSATKSSRPTTTSSPFCARSASK